MLNNLCHLFSEDFDIDVTFSVFSLHFNGQITLVLARAANQRNATFSVLHDPGFFDNFQIEHIQVCTFII